MNAAQWTTGLAHVGIPTADMDRCIAFYTGLGFEVAHETIDPSCGARVTFLTLGNLMIETYEGAANPVNGAVDHFAIDTTDLDAAFAWVKENGYTILSNDIEALPFWENGVRFFIIEGPNKERIEFCHKN